MGSWDCIWCMKYECMHVCIIRVCTSRVGSRQASQNKLIWFTLLCYLLWSGDKIAYFSHLKVILLIVRGISFFVLLKSFLGQLEPCLRSAFQNYGFSELKYSVRENMEIPLYFYTSKYWQMFGIEKKKAPGLTRGPRLNFFQYTFLVSSFETFINVILEYT